MANKNIKSLFQQEAVTGIVTIFGAAVCLGVIVYFNEARCSWDINDVIIQSAPCNNYCKQTDKFQDYIEEWNKPFEKEEKSEEQKKDLQEAYKESQREAQLEQMREERDEARCRVFEAQDQLERANNNVDNINKEYIDLCAPGREAERDQYINDHIWDHDSMDIIAAESRVEERDTARCDYEDAKRDYENLVRDQDRRCAE